MTSENKGNEEKVEVQDLASSFEGLRKSGKYSDLTIKCKGREFKVHRAIICSQSKPLAAMIDGDWKESQTGIINLDEDPPEIIEKMIQFLYTLRYDDNRGSVSDAEAVQNPDSNRQVTKPENPPPQIPETAEGPLLTNAKLFALGDLYDISGLRYYAKCRYEETVKNRWNNEFFTQSIELVYDRCSEESLKEVMVQAAYNNIKILLERGEFLQLLKTCAEFSYGVLRSLLDKGAWMLYECNCSSNPKRIQYRVTCSYCGRNLANEYKTM